MQTKQTQVAPRELYSRGVSMRKSAISAVPPTTNNLTSVYLIAAIIALSVNWRLLLELRFVLYIRPDNAHSQPCMERKLTFASFPGPAQLFRTGKRRKAERGLGTICLNTLTAVNSVMLLLYLYCVIVWQDCFLLHGQRIARDFGSYTRPHRFTKNCLIPPYNLAPRGTTMRPVCFSASKEICSNQSAMYECF